MTVSFRTYARRWGMEQWPFCGGWVGVRFGIAIRRLQRCRRPHLMIRKLCPHGALTRRSVFWLVAPFAILLFDKIVNSTYYCIMFLLHAVLWLCIMIKTFCRNTFQIKLSIKTVVSSVLVLQKRCNNTTRDWEENPRKSFYSKVSSGGKRYCLLMSFS